MTEPKFTPGPWVLGNTDKFLFGVKRGNGTEPIGYVYGPSFPERSEVGQRALANAHLIAAAPELYEALEAVIYVQTEHEGRPIFSHTQQKSGTRQWRIDAMEAYKKAEIAFKKARGEV